MVRTWSIVLGVGLVILGLVGLGNTPPAQGTWMAWLDILGGIVSFLVGLSARGRMGAETAMGSRQYNNAGGTLAICVGLFAMWLIALATGSATKAMAWWNFGFACVYGIVSYGAFTGRAVLIQRPFEDRKRHEPPRRAA